MKYWDDAEDELLRSLYERGDTYDAIAAQIEGRTRDGIRKRCALLGFELRKPKRVVENVVRNEDMDAVRERELSRKKLNSPYIIWLRAMCRVSGQRR